MESIPDFKNRVFTVQELANSASTPEYLAYKVAELRHQLTWTYDKRKQDALLIAERIGEFVCGTAVFDELVRLQSLSLYEKRKEARSK